jgi:hypothetical protein
MHGWIEGAHGRGNARCACRIVSLRVLGLNGLCLETAGETL